MKIDRTRERVTIDKAAKIVGVSRRTIYNWLELNKIQHVRTAGGQVRIFVDSLVRGTGEARVVSDHPTVRFISPSAVPTVGTTLRVGEADLADICRAVSIRSVAGELSQVDVEVVAREGIDVVMPAQVTLHVTTSAGLVVIEEETPDGKRFRVERDPNGTDL